MAAGIESRFWSMEDVMRWSMPDLRRPLARLWSVRFGLILLGFAALIGLTMAMGDYTNLILIAGGLAVVVWTALET